MAARRAPAVSTQVTAAASQAAATALTHEAGEGSSLTKVAEITRKLYHQGNAEGVLKTAVSEICGPWRAARRIFGILKTPSSTLTGSEYQEGTTSNPTAPP